MKKAGRRKFVGEIGGEEAFGDIFESGEPDQSATRA